MSSDSSPDYGIMTDVELIGFSRQDDPAASEELYRRYTDVVEMKARHYFLVGADRDDLKQVGMIGFFKAVRDYDAKKSSSFRAFAEMCIVRQIKTAIKQATRLKHSPLNMYKSFYEPAFDDDSDKQLLDTIGASSALDPEEMYIKQEFSKNFEDAINNGLSPFEHDVLIRFLDGLTYAQIADELGKSTKAVDNALQRIRKKLEKILKD